MSKIENFDRINEQDFTVRDIDREFPAKNFDFIQDDGSGNVVERIQETRGDLPLKLNVDDNSDEFLTGLYRGVNKFFVGEPKDQRDKNNVGLLQRGRSNFRKEVNKFLVKKGELQPKNTQLGGNKPFDINNFLFSQTGNEGAAREALAAMKIDRVNSRNFKMTLIDFVEQTLKFFYILLIFLCYLSIYSNGKHRRLKYYRIKGGKYYLR